MLDLIDCWILLIVGCTALGVFGLLCAVAAMILTRREAARRDKLVAVSEVSRDWQPTGRINAVTDAWVMESEKDDIPSNFVFRIEENRLVRDIGGGEVIDPLAPSRQGRGERNPRGRLCRAPLHARLHQHDIDHGGLVDNQ
jgi:hypothetical protein